MKLGHNSRCINENIFFSVHINDVGTRFAKGKRLCGILAKNPVCRKLVQTKSRIETIAWLKRTTGWSLSDSFQYVNELYCMTVIDIARVTELNNKIANIIKE